MHFPIKNGGSFHSYVKVPEGTNSLRSFSCPSEIGKFHRWQLWQIHRPGPGLNHGSNLGCPRLQGKNPVPAVVMRPPKMIKDGGLTIMVILYIYISSASSASASSSSSSSSSSLIIIIIIIIIIDHHHWSSSLIIIISQWYKWYPIRWRILVNNYALLSSKNQWYFCGSQLALISWKVSQFCFGYMRWWYVLYLHSPTSPLTDLAASKGLKEFRCNFILPWGRQSRRLNRLGLTLIEKSLGGISFMCSPTNNIK